MMLERNVMTSKNELYKDSNQTPISNMGIFKRTPGSWFLTPHRHIKHRAPAPAFRTPSANVFLTPGDIAKEIQPVNHLLHTDELPNNLSPKKI